MFDKLATFVGGTIGFVARTATQAFVVITVARWMGVL